MAIQEHAPKWLGALTLPLAAAALACTPGASARETSSAPPPPTNVSAGGLGKCNPVEFAAALGVPTPAPKDFSLPPNIAEINARVANCDYSITDPEKAVYRRVMPLITRDLQATPAPARPEQRVVPGAGGGAPPPDLIPPTFTPVPPLPSATPRSELTSTIAITLPDGTKATATLPPFTATLEPATATPVAEPTTKPPELSSQVINSFDQKVAAEKKAHPEYTQFLDAGGILIKAPAGVDTKALETAKINLLKMLSARPDIKQRIIAMYADYPYAFDPEAKKNASLAIIPKNGRLTDLPEWRELLITKGPNNKWTTERGSDGIPGYPTAVGEENLLKLPSDPSRRQDLLVHVLAHTISTMGLTAEEQAQWQKIYQDAMTTGRGAFAGKYAVTNQGEYFAMLAQFYYGGFLGQVEANSPQAIQRHDPPAYNFLKSVFGPPSPLVNPPW